MSPSRKGERSGAGWRQGAPGHSDGGEAHGGCAGARQLRDADSAARRWRRRAAWQGTGPHCWRRPWATVFAARALGTVRSRGRQAAARRHWVTRATTPGERVGVLKLQFLYPLVFAPLPCLGAWPNPRQRLSPRPLKVRGASRHERGTTCARDSTTRARAAATEDACKTPPPGPRACPGGHGLRRRAKPRAPSPGKASCGGPGLSRA